MAKKTARRERIVCVSLRPDGTLRIEPDPVKVKVGMRVRWITIVRDAKRIGVVFTKRKGTPFKEAGLAASGPGQVLSAPVAEIARGKKFKYTLELHVGRHVIKQDPDVEVER